jgi:2-C-methyl-D-erythritol 4-phosphate cytidylyltransferase
MHAHDRILVAAPQESVDEIRSLLLVLDFRSPFLWSRGSAAPGFCVRGDATPGTGGDDRRGPRRVRPFVRAEDIEAVILAAHKSGAAVLAIPIVDTVKQIRKDLIDSTLTREHLVLAQTPQVFRIEVAAGSVRTRRENTTVRMNRAWWNASVCRLPSFADLRAT